MTLQEIESACENQQPVDFSRPEMPQAKLDLERTLYPYGFLVRVRTNAGEVLDILDGMWGKFEARHDAPPVCVDVQVLTTDTFECPPTPAYRLMPPLLMTIADRDNYSIVDMERSTARISLSSAALRYKQYAGYYFLGAPVSCIATTPVHAGCVALRGRGVLLCGDSGAGKSTLSYACARKGWTYIADDGTYLLTWDRERTVTGNCHQVRLRPASASLFPEIERLKMMPRAAGKPSVELQTSTIPELRCAETTRVDFIVFLKRSFGDTQEVVRYRKDVARQFMRQMLFAPPEIREAQYAAIERLLTADVLELRYRDLDWAVERLERLVDQG